MDGISRGHDVAQERPFKPFAVRPQWKPLALLSREYPDVFQIDNADLRHWLTPATA
jgi:hypothetical protein